MAIPDATRTVAEKWEGAGEASSLQMPSSGAATPPHDALSRKFVDVPRSERKTGGGEGIRTLGLYIANVALCQLSYTPGCPQRLAARR